MNLAYLSADFGVPVFGFKGASIHVREMCAALRRDGHPVCVISPATALEESGQQQPGDQREAAPPASPFLPPAQRRGELTFLSVTPPEKHKQILKDCEALDKFWGMKTRLRQELRNQFYNLTLYEAALAYLRSCPVDFIYERYSLFGHAGLRLARELGVPHLLEVNAPLAYEQEKMRGLEMKELAAASERRLFQGTDRVLVVSRPLQEFVHACEVPLERIQILPNAVDPQKFISAEEGRAVRAHYGWHGKCVIGFVGSLKPWHGTETLLQAFHHLQAPHAHLLIVGDGPGREALEEYARAHDLTARVTFTGNVPHEQIPDYIAAMDVTVAPYTPNENFYYSPIKIFEYMVMGKPVVAGALGQVRDLIADGETGLLFEPGNLEQLTTALRTLANDQALCARMGRRAKAWVLQEHTWENNARKVVAIAKEFAKS